ncbi:DUF4870 domain-containing protein [Janibacter sp. YIM B02568]|uniref:DUF4870 domain-containing protein n=1 Tax=Janibacter endophyticus TaxID=2806261 RepID=UPI0019511E97|nr:DUF4870 domain-containing protein [Janibacter endophyticus]MBM6545483.1 DUF4870 domain-containing protein [Janibacter endophyticus]
MSQIPNQPYPNPQQPGVYPPGPEALAPEQQRSYGMLAHLAPAIALPLSAGTLGFVASLVVYLMYRDRGDFVRQHAANSLNVQIMTLILLAISGLLMFVLVGFLTYPLVVVIATVIHVIGAMKANNGEMWQPPMTPRFVS